MATLWVTEYAEIPMVREVPTPIAVEPAVAEQTVSFTTSTQSSSFNGSTRYVRVISDADCHLAFGSSPIATTSKQKLIAGVAEWRAVTAQHKVAAVTAS